MRITCVRNLEPYFESPYSQICKHEFVLSGSRQKKLGVRTLDMAKRLLDFGYHPPTIYFPLNVEECLMIEPTETESKETMDAFADVMIQIAKEVEENPGSRSRCTTYNGHWTIRRGSSSKKTSLTLYKRRTLVQQKKP